uniref:PROTOGLOBIN n=1 Tax=Methanosarcina acetivorans TaxID=2214 RepID=UPI000175439F|nr:Chain A, Protoglobin [Methanosarcina acetivorans]2VEE_A Chain A, PROTOGLOBIN [Methanosarcina acetivorans]2VEE_B Chain B, PROTOGLOBIN [Methanosarcina acetivorans]2VEE_C Chain C, PROTOGLOBIN [Methanosarcina acetivorans]2VEE_D Chain D, PROTOGLOBIN [Methanosarcina acetivorans]2VEE_E Chain E, PROTOGLOBIN [Methanosarcina acetivorans]2VEE_F Chain F, PROTOGLOBIN [Methanosarcina acetivorans]2VEE_G Chain G, PROTOGLOBIN [Methanosarcina acetivorans]2VEE_H Chain H, PROTOGLOBIN [Methanosarcina acetivo
MSVEKIPGYTYGETENRAPFNLEDLKLLKEAVMFTAEDEEYIQKAGEVLEDQVEEILDTWYGFVGSHPHLLYYFTSPDGTPNEKYLAAVRKRFSRWILDTSNRSYDQAWLDYQYEIGLRHHRTKKNQTDNVESVPNIGYRYLVAFIYPITATMKPFLARKGHTPEEVEKMYQAWFKATTLQVALWSYPYVKYGDF